MEMSNRSFKVMVQGPVYTYPLCILSFMFLHHWDNKDAQCKTTVPAEQGHGNRYLQKRKKKDLKSAVYMKKWMDGRMRKKFGKMAVNMRV
jgi:hypothetical protein